MTRARRQAGLADQSEIAPAMRVALVVGALDVQDGHVGLDRGDVQQARLGAD